MLVKALMPSPVNLGRLLLKMPQHLLALPSSSRSSRRINWKKFPRWTSWWVGTKSCSPQLRHLQQPHLPRTPIKRPKILKTLTLPLLKSPSAFKVSQVPAASWRRVRTKMRMQTRLLQSRLREVQVIRSRLREVWLRSLGSKVNPTQQPESWKKRAKKGGKQKLRAPLKIQPLPQISVVKMIKLRAVAPMLQDWRIGR